MGKSLENAYALVIGISKYLDKRISELKYTHADADAFAKLMTDPKRIGLKKENVRILLDENATLSNIKESIVNWLIKKADENSTVYIFFAGHGGAETDYLRKEKDNLAKYLLPYDTKFDTLFSSALSTIDFDNFLHMIRSKKLIIFLDACHSGGMASSRDVKAIEDPYKRLAEGEGTVVISASKHDQLSYEDANIGHGVFTYHLINALSGKADDDKNGYVTLFEVYKYLQNHVPASAMEVASAIQEPVLSGGNIGKDFSISINPELIEMNKIKTIKEEKIRKLLYYYTKGEFSGKLYERLKNIVKADREKLPEKDTHIAMLTDNFLNGEISINTLFEDLGYIEPELFAGKATRELETSVWNDSDSGIDRGKVVTESEEGDKKEKEAEENKKKIMEWGLEARNLYKEGDHALAIEKWKDVLKIDPDYDEAITGIKKSEKALKEIDFTKKQIDELTTQAKMLFNKSDYSGSINKWNQVREIDPKNQTAIDGIRKAKTRIEEEDKEKTILKLLKDAQRLSIDGNHALAIPKWREILERDPENNKAMEGLRESERILGDISELNVFAQRLYDDGMYSRALEKWNEVLKIDLRNKIALEGIGKLGNVQMVKKFCTSCGQQNIRGVKFCTKCGTNLLN